MRRPAAFAALSVALLAGCQELGPTADDAEELGRDYVRAAVARDWAGACALRSRLERHKLDRGEGSCEEALAAVLEPRLDELRGARTGRIQVDGEIAGIEIVSADGRRVTILAAVLDQDRWRLETLEGAELF